MGRLNRAGRAAAGVLPLHAALVLGGVEGRIAHRLGRRGPSADAVRAVFSLTEREGRQVAREQAANAVRSRNLWARALVETGLDQLRPLIEIRGREHLEARAGQPVVVLLAPWGPLAASVTPVTDVRDDALFITRGLEVRARQRGVAISPPGPDAGHSAAALKAGVDHLRGGGLIGLSLVPETRRSTTGVAFFGGVLDVPRGVATLVGRTGAPVIPVISAWHAATPRVTFYPPVELDPEAADPEADLLGRLVATFEAAARAAPSEGDGRLMAAIAQAGAATPSSSPAS